MSIVEPTTKTEPDVVYPTGDGEPMAETPTHRDNMIGLIDVLRTRFRRDPDVYVSGNMFIYYVPGRKRRHVAPDVFVVLGVPDRDREAYFVWEEGKGPDIVFELTSPSTEDEDLGKKFLLYQDTLRVREYFLFDPLDQYLKPSLQGFRLIEGRYEPIRPVEGRLRSEVLGLHVGREGKFLRLHDPETGERLPTSPEARGDLEERLRREAEARRAEERLRREAEAGLRREAEARRAVEEEIERLRREVEELRRRAGGGA